MESNTQLINKNATILFRHPTSFSNGPQPGYSRGQNFYHFAAGLAYMNVLQGHQCELRVQLLSWPGDKRGVHGQAQGVKYKEMHVNSCDI